MRKPKLTEVREERMKPYFLQMESGREQEYRKSPYESSQKIDLIWTKAVDLLPA